MRRTQLFAYSLVLGLTACGGGGGGGGGDSGSSRSAVPPQTALTYNGSTAPASVSATTAGTVASSVIGASGAGLGGSLFAGVSADGNAAAQPTGAAGFARRLARAVHRDQVAQVGGTSSARAGAAFSQAIPCDSGVININGTVDDNTGTGLVNIDYVDCRTGADTLNGPGTLNITGFDKARGLVTDGTLNFTRVRFSGPGANFDLSGTIGIQVRQTSNFMASDAATETITENLVTQDNNTGKQTQVNNLRFTNVYSSINNPTFFNQTINGDVCQTDQGCVTVSTTTAPNTDPWGPLYFSTTSQDFPDWGIINLTSGSSVVHIQSLGVDLAKITVDTNNDGTPENTARVRWSEIGTALTTDLGDSDGDGMHNSWESAKGLNPNNAADASGDLDNDGFSNLVEYQRGSDPSTNGSLPVAERHLWVTNVSDLNVDSNGQIQAFLNGGTSGVLVDPATTETGAAFSGGTPSGNGTSVASWTLTQPNPTGAPKTWVLTNTATGATHTLTNVAGTGATSLIRYGAHGLAFRTIGTFSPGYIYLVESTALVP
jgi:hypothetical protein